ncbi:MAG TPA: hypothetical protein VFZ59_09640 [Verrucomicrobiae bacterium]|nr:hypothetical protein [Verrucomicrobiae bacterium]
MKIDVRLIVLVWKQLFVMAQHSGDATSTADKHLPDRFNQQVTAPGQMKAPPDHPRQLAHDKGEREIQLFQNSLQFHLLGAIFDLLLKYRPVKLNRGVAN